LSVDRLAAAIGKGLIAGAAGTAAMTVSSTIESKLRNREPSSAPSDAAGKVLGVQPRNPEGRARFSNIVHWSYGTGWGVVRGLIGVTGLDGAAAAGTHFAAVWGSSLVTLPALEVAPPVWKMPTVEVAIDALHHVVYVTATTAVYDALDV
jgi:hypothetical protein